MLVFGVKGCIKQTEKTSIDSHTGYDKLFTWLDEILLRYNDNILMPVGLLATWAVHIFSVCRGEGGWRLHTG